MDSYAPRSPDLSGYKPQSPDLTSYRPQSPAFIPQHSNDNNNHHSKNNPYAPQSPHFSALQEFPGTSQATSLPAYTSDPHHSTQTPQYQQQQQQQQQQGQLPLWNQRSFTQNSSHSNQHQPYQDSYAYQLQQPPFHSFTSDPTMAPTTRTSNRTQTVSYAEPNDAHEFDAYNVSSIAPSAVPMKLEPQQHQQHLDTYQQHPELYQQYQTASYQQYPEPPYQQMQSAPAVAAAPPPPTPARRGRKPKSETQGANGRAVNAPPVLQKMDTGGVEVKTKFPTARIKRIMQADEDVGKVAQVTPVVVAKALELFMIRLITSSADAAKARGSKKVMSQHMKIAVMQDDQFDNLRDIMNKVPDAPTKSTSAAGAANSGDAGDDDDDAAPAAPVKSETRAKGKGGRAKKRRDSDDF